MTITLSIITIALCGLSIWRNIRRKEPGTALIMAFVCLIMLGIFSIADTLDYPHREPVRTAYRGIAI
ncbi:MAG: hypothetical protein V2I97_15940 [Desulfococcaceae bacterium]|nr:hypothetical protein [Desulfococcaceae bacterium]